MKKIFTDTNLWLRFFLSDDPRLGLRAREIIARAAEGEYLLIINAAVFLEMTWVLTSFYKIEREKTLSFLTEILRAKYVEVEEADILSQTLDFYRLYKIDIMDAYLAAKVSQTASKTIFSFDRDLDKIKGIKRLE